MPQPRLRFMWAREAILKGAQGYSPWTIAEVVGYAKGEVGLEMTMARYAGDETMEAKRACVEAVRSGDAKVDANCSDQGQVFAPSRTSGRFDLFATPSPNDRPLRRLRAAEIPLTRPMIRASSV